MHNKLSLLVCVQVSLYMSPIPKTPFLPDSIVDVDTNRHMSAKVSKASMEELLSVR